MDFGLDGLLDRLERDYGRWAAKALAGLMAVTVVVVCLSVIVAALVQAYAWVQGTLAAAGWAQTLLSAAQIVAGLLVLVFLISSMVSAIEVKRRLGRARDVMATTEALHVNVEERLSRVEADQRRVIDQSDQLHELAKVLLVQVETFNEKKLVTGTSSLIPEETFLGSVPGGSERS